MKNSVFTREGYQKKVEEYDDLRTRRIPEAIKNLADAREKGDISENAEYDIAQKELEDLNRKATDLHVQLSNPTIVEGAIDDGTVGILTWVTFKNLSTQKIMTFKLVPEGEINIREGKISTGSPIGSALMGKRVGDKVHASVPTGKQELEILNISIKKPVL